MANHRPQTRSRGSRLRIGGPPAPAGGYALISSAPHRHPWLCADAGEEPMRRADRRRAPALTHSRPTCSHLVGFLPARSAMSAARPSSPVGAFRAASMSSMSMVVMLCSFVWWRSVARAGSPRRWTDSRLGLSRCGRTDERLRVHPAVRPAIGQAVPDRPLPGDGPGIPWSAPAVRVIAFAERSRCGGRHGRGWAARRLSLLVRCSGACFGGSGHCGNATADYIPSSLRR